jgi:hypothetical protein
MFLTLNAPSVAKAWAMALRRVFFEGDEIKADYDSGELVFGTETTFQWHIQLFLCTIVLIVKIRLHFTF